MNTHLIITALFGLVSLFIGSKVSRDIKLSWPFLPAFIIVVSIGIGLSYVFSFPSEEWAEIINEYGGPLLLGVLFTIILGLPFLVNYKQTAPIFVSITLLLSFAIGLWIFSGIFYACISTFVGFSIGLLFRPKRKK